MAIAQPREWIFRDVREFIYRLSLSVIGVDLETILTPGNIHYKYKLILITPQKINIIINNKKLTSTFDDIEHIHSVICWLYNDMIFTFSLNKWIRMANAANNLNYKYYIEVSKVLSEKFPQELEEQILDFLNIPHNYDWMATLMEYTKCQ